MQTSKSHCSWSGPTAPPSLPSLLAPPPSSRRPGCRVDLDLDLDCPGGGVGVVADADDTGEEGFGLERAPPMAMTTNGMVMLAMTSDPNVFRKRSEPARTNCGRGDEVERRWGGGGVRYVHGMAAMGVAKRSERVRRASEAAYNGPQQPSTALNGPQQPSTALNSPQRPSNQWPSTQQP